MLDHMASPSFCSVFKTKYRLATQLAVYTKVSHRCTEEKARLNPYRLAKSNAEAKITHLEHCSIAYYYHLRIKLMS